MEQRFDIGTIELVLTGKNTPIRNRKTSEKEALAAALAEDVAQRLNHELSAQFGRFYVEVVSISDGCILVKLKIWYEKSRIFANEHFQLPAMLLAVVSTVNSCYPVKQDDYPQNIVPIECKIQRGHTQIASSIIKIHEGESLLSSLKDHERDGASLSQIAVAVFQANPACFPDGNIHKVKADSVLIVPAQEIIKRIPRSYADGIVYKLKR